MEYMRAIFRCDACSEPAAIVELVAKGIPHLDDERMNRWLEDRSDAAGSIVMQGFLTFYGQPFSVSKPVGADVYASVAEALGERDPLALYDALPDKYSKYVSFYCAICRRSYCREHWRLEETIEEDMKYVDDWVGRCPQGHGLFVDHTSSG